MNELPLCRWREHQADDSLLCQSSKYIAPPNPVAADFCRSCSYIDHEQSEIRTISDAPGARIALATLYTPEMSEMGQLSSGALCAYAARHGYAAVVATGKIDATRPASWSKLLLVERHLASNPACEWVMWIDADAVVTNPARRVEDLIGEDVDFLVAEDLPPSPMNLGVFLIRNCPATRDLLRRAYEKGQYTHHPWWEQPAIVEALSEGGAAVRFRVVPRRLFNAFPGEHREGDFILHFAGSSPEAKLAGVRKAVLAARDEPFGGKDVVRHLLYHVYPLAKDGGSVWRWNVEKLKRRLSLFNGRRMIGIAVGPEMDHAEAVRAALAGCGCEFVEVANDPGLREGTTFLALHERLAEFTGPEHVTLYGHAEGVTSEGWATGVRPWTEALYETCLDHWPAVRRLLETHPLVGPFKRIGCCFPESPRSTWDYAGSWRWFRNADLFARDWRDIDRAWIGIESHLSLHFRPHEAACLVHEFAAEGLALYGADYWRDHAGPDLERWREEHLAYRWHPLLLTCILTSHRKQSVHESIGSVLAQTSSDWQLVVIDSGELLAAGAFERYRGDPRITVVASGETAKLRSEVGIQAWCINECFRRGLVLGDLACYLCDDDVYDPGAFAAWLMAARANPVQSAWHGRADRCEVRGGAEVKVGELHTWPVGTDLDCKADGMQVCHRTSVYVPWPEERALAWHTDGLWMSALGKRTPIHPLPVTVGRHRHCPDSTFTRPVVSKAERLAVQCQEPRVYFPCGEPSNNHVAGLVELVELAKPRAALEIGCFRGVSGEVFALHCDRVVCVDPWPDERVYEEFRNRMRGYPHVEIVRGRSPEALERFADGSFDLVYIDGDHDDAAVRADSAASRRLVRSGGWLAGHDFCADFLEVVAAVRDVLGKTQVFADSSWLVRL